MLPREPVAKRANRLIRPLPDRPHDDRPACGVKARRALHWRTVVAFHKEVSLLPTIAVEYVFRNKILRRCSPEGLIPDYDCELHWGWHRETHSVGGTAKRKAGSCNSVSKGVAGIQILLPARLRGAIRKMQGFSLQRQK
jgi:hypothetical protein